MYINLVAYINCILIISAYVLAVYNSDTERLQPASRHVPNLDGDISFSICIPLVRGMDVYNYVYLVIINF